jgi:hypothetical protein
MKYLSGVAAMFLMDDNDPFVRIAEVEYNREFRRFEKAFGRRPTKEEAKQIILG